MEALLEGIYNRYNGGTALKAALPGKLWMNG